MKLGLQLYTLRRETEEDFAGALAKVSKFGYQGVELAGYGGLEANELKRVLQELNLEAIGSHVSLDRLTHALDDEIAYNQTIGNNRLVMPYLGADQRKDEQAWRDLAEQLSVIGSRCAEQGMTLLYHNHDFELMDQMEGRLVLDALYASVPDSHLKFEPDVCWIRYAGYDPAAYITNFRGRVPLVHLKDLQILEDGSPLTVELGQGVVDLDACIRAASQSGAEWLIVEQDECRRPPFESIEMSLNWLRNYKENGGAIYV